MAARRRQSLKAAVIPQRRDVKVWRAAGKRRRAAVKVRQDREKRMISTSPKVLLGEHGREKAGKARPSRCHRLE